MERSGARLGVVAVVLMIGGVLTAAPFAAAAQREPERAGLDAVPASSASTLPTLTVTPIPVDAAPTGRPSSSPAAAPRPTAIAAAASTPSRGYTSTMTTQDAQWILRSQRADGSITTHVDQRRVEPYLSNFAAIGLARAAADTRSPVYLDAAWRYLDWYAGHQDSRGFITDYTVTRSGTLRSTGDMDSTDAYAGTYLLAVRAVHAQAGDSERLATLHRSITKAVAAIRATQDRDGLTWAKPSWRVKYLMDQAETLAGLRAATALAQELGDQRLAATSSTAARRLQHGIDSLWNPSIGAYDWAKHSDGTRVATHWNRLYPDATQQAWAVAFGAAPTKRSAQLMATFTKKQPTWDQPTRAAWVDGATRPAGYWSVVGLALDRTGRTADAAEGLRSIRRAAVSGQRAWPFTPSDSGQLILVGNRSVHDLAP